MALLTNHKADQIAQIKHPHIKPTKPSATDNSWNMHQNWAESHHITVKSQINASVTISGSAILTKIQNGRKLTLRLLT
jgi:hypothetical protein